MKTFVAVVVVFLVGSLFLHAQNRRSGVSGVVVDSASRAPLGGATVIVENTAGDIVSGARSDPRGHFLVDELPAGAHTLVVRYVGYASIKKSITVPDADTLRIGTIVLAQTTISSGTVVVSGDPLPVNVKDDTLEFKASQYKTDKNASAEDLVKKMPGVEVQNGQVKAQGENVKRVLVDGKPFFGDDPAATLKNLPSEIIDRIQVFDQGSDQSQFTKFDDGERSKTLNVITRADRRNGQFGKIYAGYGDQDRYTAGGNLNYFKGDTRISILALSNNINQQNFSIQDILGATGGGSTYQRMAGAAMRMFGGGSGGGRMRFGGGGGGFGSVGDFLVGQSDGITQSHGLGVNYSDQFGTTLSLTGSYFFNYTDNDAVQSTARQNFLGEVTQLNDQSANGSTKNINHRLNLRADVTIDSMNSLLFTPRLTWQSNDKATSALTSTSESDSLLNRSTTSSTNNGHAYNLSGELLYRLKFATEGRTFSASLRTNAGNNSADQSTDAFYEFFQNGTTIGDSLVQAVPTTGNQLSYGANLNYTEPIAKDQQLQLSYNYNNATNESDKRTYGYDSATQTITQLNTSLSNTASSHYITHRPGVSYRFTITPERDSTQKNAGAMIDMMMGGGGRERREGGGMGGMFSGVGAWSFNLGVDYQIATLKVDQTFPSAFNESRTFTNVLPSFNISTRPTLFSNLRFNYRTSTDQPGISQLQNVVDNSDPLRLSAGNPELNQEFTHRLMAHYGTFSMSSGSGFFGMINVSMTQDKIVQSTFVASQDTVLQNIESNGTPLHLGAGAQFSRPVNANGYWNANSFVAYTFPIELFTGFKVSMNANVSGNYTRDISYINDNENVAGTWVVTPALGIASNVNEYVDFSLSGRTAYSTTSNSIESDLNQTYFTHTVTARTTLINHDTTSDFLNGWLLTGDFSYTLTTGLASGYNEGVPLLSMGIGKRMFEGRGELKLSVFDLLNKNNSITRNTGSGYVEDTQTNVLKRYAMLSFTYNLRMF